MDKGKFIPFVVAEKRNTGISPQTAKGLYELEQQMKPARVEPPVQYKGGMGTLRRPEATIRLPNGDWVTPQEYEQLLQLLQQRR
jgi:hypothetical protein